MVGKKTLFAAGLALLVAAPVTAARAFGGFGGHGGPGGGPPPMMMLLRSANLTSDQQTQVHQILSANRTQIHSLFQQMHGLDEQIATKLLGPGTVSAADFSSLETQKAAIQQQLDALMISTAIQVRNVLTPTQISTMAQTNQKLESLHQQIEALMGPGPGGDQPPPPPQD
ncbi:MAG TPA: periplasmic heavy metal sensor [Candidatus Binataceae bacterium]|nr:periplasmic heavy metal sensor [Candidatus Binataceae bacterium]